MKKEVNYDKIMALIPEYIKDRGDCTRLIMENSDDIIWDKNIHSCINRIADYYCTNLKANRRVYGNMLGIKNKVPYVFSDKHVMIQFKSRIPVTKKDSASGYFDINYFNCFVRENETEYIVLKEDRKLELKQLTTSCQKYVNYARLIKKSRR